MTKYRTIARTGSLTAAQLVVGPVLLRRRDEDGATVVASLDVIDGSTHYNVYAPGVVLAVGEL